MGRPIKKSFFGNLNAPYDDAQTGGPTGSGGESVASVAIATTGSDYIAIPAMTFSAPTMVGGTTATIASSTLKVVSVAIANPGSTYTTGTVVTLGDGATPIGTTTGTYTVAASVRIDAIDTSTGAVTAISLVNGGNYSALPTNEAGNPSDAGSTVANLYVSTAGDSNLRLNVQWGLSTVTLGSGGSGYASTPTVNDGGNGSVSVVMTAAKSNALLVTAFIPAADGGTSALAADIMKQEGTRRYLVRTSEGQGVCKLVAVASNALVAGEMNLIATDSLGSTYYVTKLTGRRATLTRQTDGGSGFEYATGEVTRWGIAAAVTGTVSIANG